MTDDDCALLKDLVSENKVLIEWQGERIERLLAYLLMRQYGLTYDDCMSISAGDLEA